MKPESVVKAEAEHASPEQNQNGSEGQASGKGRPYSRPLLNFAIDIL